MVQQQHLLLLFDVLVLAPNGDQHRLWFFASTIWCLREESSCVLLVVVVDQAAAERIIIVAKIVNVALKNPRLQLCLRIARFETNGVVADSGREPCTTTRFDSATSTRSSSCG